MLKYIVYSNTDYLDILKIQTDYIIGNKDVTLFINKNELDLNDLYSKYNNVIFYDNNDVYSKRINYCLSQINYEYFLFLHDIDILINVDDNIIKLLYNIILENKYDRIDLKYTDNYNPNLIKKINEEYNLVKQINPSDYIYNVNPSIWKKETLQEITSNFISKTYRTIEDIDVQIFSQKFNVFKINSKEFNSCGYFKCVPFFTFLHISHSGKLLPLNDSYTTIYGQPYIDIKDEYIKIVDKYNLKNSPKWIKN